MKWLIRHRLPSRLMLDFLAFQSAFALVFFTRFKTGWFENPITPDFHVLISMAGVLTIFWYIVYAFRGLYLHEIGTSRYEAFSDSLKGATAGVLILFLLFFDPGEKITFSRMILFSYGFLVFLFTGIYRATYRTFIRSCFSKRHGLYRSIIVGYGSRGRKLFRTLKSVPQFGYEINAIVPLDNKQKKDIPDNLDNCELEELEEYISKSVEKGEPIEFVHLALQEGQSDLIQSILLMLSAYNVRVMVIPDFYQILVGMARTQQLYGVPLVEIFPDLLSPFQRFVKRFMDILAGLTILIGLSPVLIITAIILKLDSRGPIIYSQKRVGLHGKEFFVHKFRSMYQDAEKRTGPVWATEDDPRITRFGKIMRQTRLDELPQAWCVLKGDMSLVGPRPERKFFVEDFAKQIPFYTRRLNVKPGITGWAQVRGGYDTDLESVKEKLQYDLFYLENISIGLDIKILVNTVWVVLTAKGQ